MPQDLLQIALEHHRAGRLTQAQTGYLAVLQEDPARAEALHWLGVLECQAGQYLAATPLLERAAAAAPNDAAYQHNLGQAYLGAGRKDDAVKAFSRATAADPGSTGSLVSLALACLSRALPGDAAAAVAALRQAASAGLDTAELHYHNGVALLTAGRFVESVAAFQQALARRGDDAMTYYHLGLAHRAAGQIKETRKALIKALELEPAMSQAWCALGMLDVEGKKLTEAAGLFRRAVAANRHDYFAWQELERVLRATAKNAEADAVSSQRLQATANISPRSAPATIAPLSVADLQRRITPTVGQAQAHFAMAAMLNFFPPTQIPADTVTSLFDRYAPGFDEHLRGKLEYQTPERLAEAVQELWDGKPWDILDLGCGTGLCGPLLRPMAATLCGVDLSAAMIERAKERGIYDRLEVGDLVEFMRKTPRAHDLLAAADVLIYVGELSPTFEAAAISLRPGGLFVFSVETTTGDRYELSQSGRRYMHSEPYLQHMAKIYGFTLERFLPIIVRKESNQPVAGHLAALRLQP